ncbi:MAG: hypothetical protein COV91_03015 [Candidatus Taylorbacteria bacterium CG11_big_fil_rev_8_21_14_0_20_46_11]|uniref:Uncharacterized protein n=1 Tax=Candidatus Taylorbacteria bacterium CG11_big_fil_rev_8_21_14_0_20_46_11 TaxID=1975025 RepID=A0A2H0KE33_9BACT|nr:MAG: hypothetical protein COV91_03015 [Candidatus Taylorbacteria bacterium CG11_big_fil_rev_8_21_14_0_20_46_11]
MFVLGLLLLGIMIFFSQQDCFNGGFETVCIPNHPWLFQHRSLFDFVNTFGPIFLAGGLLASLIGLAGKFSVRGGSVLGGESNSP